MKRSSPTCPALAVWSVTLPAATEDFECRISADETMVWPATAPTINQTVVIAK